MDSLAHHRGEIAAVNYDEHPWVLDDDLSWMWYDADPQSAQEKDGDFRTYLLHELGHWVVAQEQESSVGVLGLGLYGLTYDVNGHVRVVGGGGGVGLTYGKFVGPKEMLAVDTAGIVAERLNEDTDFSFADPVALFKASQTFDCDYDEARRHLRLMGITDEGSAACAAALLQAIETGAGIIRNLLPRLRAQVLRLEQIVIEQRLTKLEIAWSGKHASLLTGKPDHRYQIDYGRRPSLAPATTRRA